MANDDGGDAGGSGKSAGTQSSSALSAVADTVSQVLTIVKSLEALDAFTERSVVCEIDNVSGHKLNFDSSGFDHGGLGADLPPASIDDQKSGIFSARSSGLLTGVQGHVTYTIDDGRGSKFNVSFENPEAGGNSSECGVDSPISNAYFSNSITGNGNHGAHMRYTVGPLHGPFSLKAFLQNTKPSGFEPEAPSTSVRGLDDAKGPIAAGNRFSVRAFMRV
ncbi:MAG TPA: hypothetical protein VMH81_06935 [Bryobacteraceae bacterium]|nr:hypothetical protein [Bryobacteraceae bacterium]